jgi:Rrf2 family protein
MPLVASRDQSRCASGTRPERPHNGAVHISAKTDYAMRALLTLAAAPEGELVKVEAITAAQGLPRKFLESILVELRRSGMVASQRGADGGYRLGRPAGDISVADVIRAVDGPLAEVRGLRPERATYAGAAEHLGEVWIAVRQSLRSVLESVSLADLLTGDLPAEVEALYRHPQAKVSH